MRERSRRQEVLDISTEDKVKVTGNWAEAGFLSREGKEVQRLSVRRSFQVATSVGRRQT